MKAKVYIFFILAVLSCNAPTQQEQRIIHRLNGLYPEYFFSPSDDFIGMRLKVNLSKHRWDSLALKTTYDSTVGKYKETDGVPWAYLCVYDKTDNYLFTISKDNVSGKHIFFRE